MPHITFSNVKRGDVKKLSKALPKPLSEICDTTLDNFLFERNKGKFYYNAKKVSLYPLVKVEMFDRGIDVEKKMFDVIKNMLEAVGYTDVEVYFIHLKNESYFY